MGGRTAASAQPSTQPPRLRCALAPPTDAATGAAKAHHEDKLRAAADKLARTKSALESLAAAQRRYQQSAYKVRSVEAALDEEASKVSERATGPEGLWLVGACWGEPVAPLHKLGSTWMGPGTTANALTRPQPSRPPQENAAAAAAGEKRDKAKKSQVHVVKAEVSWVLDGRVAPGLLGAVCRAAPACGSRWLGPRIHPAQSVLRSPPPLLAAAFSCASPRS